MDSIVSYTAVLDIREESVYFLARLLLLHRRELGTRTGRRALGCYRQAVLVIRWFLDGTRVAQLACVVQNPAIGSHLREYCTPAAPGTG